MTYLRAAQILDPKIGGLADREAIKSRQELRQNTSRQAVIKTLVRQALDHRYLAVRRAATK
jgi:hypothetical protein